VGVARLDHAFERWKVGPEYDGGVHRDSLADDNRRQNRLINSGYRLLRFTAGDIYQTPDSVVDQVRWALGERRP